MDNISELIKEIASDLNALEVEVDRQKAKSPFFSLVFYPICLAIGIGIAVVLRYYKWLPY